MIGYMHELAVTQGILDRFLKSRQSPNEKRDRDLAWVDEVLGEDGA